MNKVEFSKTEKEIVITKIKKYFESELGQEIGQFDAEFLIDFFSEEVGSYYYNRGLMDARVVIASKLDDIDAGIDELEKPTEFFK